VNGYFTIHRVAFDSWLWQLRGDHFKVAITLIGMANWTPGKFLCRTGEVVDVPRGSMVTSSDSIASRARVGRQVVRTALRHLEKADFLTIKSTKLFSFITIVNYDTWQPHGVIPNQVTNHVITKCQPSANQVLTTIEEEKKEKKLSFDFDSVYQQYPRKIGKAPGLAKLKAKVKTQADYDQLVQAVATLAQAWRGKDLTYCPHFSTFASQTRWRDDMLPLPDGCRAPSKPLPPLPGVNLEEP